MDFRKILEVEIIEFGSCLDVGVKRELRRLKRGFKFYVWEDVFFLNRNRILVGWLSFLEKKCIKV